MDAVRQLTLAQIPSARKANMSEEEIIRLIKSKSQAIEENLLVSNELTEIEEKIEQFLDANVSG